MKKHSIAALGGFAAVAGSLALAATAGAGGRVVPKISFRQDAKKPGYYLVTTSPPSQLRVSLVAYAMCDFSGQNCRDPEVIDTELLPKGAKHSVSWGKAAFWEQPAFDDVGGLYPGTYRVVMAIPGTRASVSTQYKLKP